MRATLIRLAAVSTCLLASAAFADSPAPEPERREIFSADRRYRLDIETGRGRQAETETSAPATASGTAVSYGNGVRTTHKSTFDKGRLTVIELETARGEAPAATLRLFKAGESTPLWQTELDYLPASALVADSGKWVATFDAWGASGRTPNVVVLFDAGGKKTRSLSLDDLFTKGEQERLTRSVSNTWWAAGLYEGDKVPHAFSADGKHLVLKVQLGGYTRPNLEQAAPNERRVELATGKVLR
jgi:hypothetical protein